MSGLKNGLILFPDYFNLQSNKNLLGYFLHDYYYLLIVLIIIIWFYLKHTEYNKLVLILTFFLGYILIINVSYPNGADQFYLENQYLILSIIVGIPFAYDVLPNLKHQRIVLVVISAITIIGILRIYSTHTFYTTRLEWNRRILRETAQLPQKKIVLRANDIPKDTLLITWSSSYEFWLLSMLESGVARSIIIEDIPNAFDWDMSHNKSFIT